MENNKTTGAVHKTMPKVNVVLVILLSVLLAAVLALSALLITSYNNSNIYASSLEATYQKSYYDLVDNVNNAEVKLSKVLTSSDEQYSGELLTEIAKNANDAQMNLSMLPVSINGIEESITFINQLSGYCETLSKKITRDESISALEAETLQQLYNSVLKMKQSLNAVSARMANGYSILSNSLSLQNEYNDFTVHLQSIKTNDVEYPTMIYDGPFADSQIRKTVKAFVNSTNFVDEMGAKSYLANIFDVNVNSIEYQGETKSNFVTLDFIFKDNSDTEFFAQVSKAECRLITLAAYREEKEPTFNLYTAQSNAEEFVKATGIMNVECVWYDIIGGNAYFNFAPVENGVILYPDLVKVKCDLSDGQIIGYEARSYYTNHTTRNIPEFAISQQDALAKIKEGYIVETVNKALAPIRYGEVLCYEFQCTFNNDIYYIYVNGITGSVDNILKVIRTSDGSLIM